jgi:hypothetical protein
VLSWLRISHLSPVPGSVHCVVALLAALSFDVTEIASGLEFLGRGEGETALFVQLLFVVYLVQRSPFHLLLSFLSMRQLTDSR